MRQRSKGNQHFPTDVLPVLACQAELRLRTLPAIGLRDCDRDDAGVYKREDYIAGRNLPHAFVKGIPAADRITLGRPQVPAPQFVAVRLILVYPPVTHVISSSLAETGRVGPG